MDSNESSMGGSSKFAQTFRIPDGFEEVLSGLTMGILRRQPKVKIKYNLFSQSRSFGVEIIISIIFKDEYMDEGREYEWSHVMTQVARKEMLENSSSLLSRIFQHFRGRWDSTCNHSTI